MKQPGPINHTERRADRRHKVRFHLFWGRVESEQLEGEIADLSAGGCFVESEEAVQVGDLVKLRLDITGHGELAVWGTSSSG